MASNFRLFRVRGGRLVEDDNVEKKAVAVYRTQTKCSSAEAVPNVWGMGWSPDAIQIYLLVQATANSPCGEPGSFIGVSVRVADDSIVERLSEDETKRRFPTLLPRQVYAK
jgi:hypothetical protein